MCFPEVLEWRSPWMKWNRPRRKDNEDTSEFVRGGKSITEPASNLRIYQWPPFKSQTIYLTGLIFVNLWTQWQLSKKPPIFIFDFKCRWVHSIRLCRYKVLDKIWERVLCPKSNRIFSQMSSITGWGFEAGLKCLIFLLVDNFLLKQCQFIGPKSKRSCRKQETCRSWWSDLCGTFFKL